MASKIKPQAKPIAVKRGPGRPRKNQWQPEPFLPVPPAPDEHDYNPLSHDPRIKAIELALVRLGEIASTLKLITIGMEPDHARAVNMTARLVGGVQEAVAGAVLMLKRQD